MVYSNQYIICMDGVPENPGVPKIHILHALYLDVHLLLGKRRVCGFMIASFDFCESTWYVI